MGQIFQTVSENIFKVDIPCRTTIQNIIDEGHYLSRKQVGFALTEAEILFADCTSRDGRKILDAGVHLSDKRTMGLGFTNITKENVQTVSSTVQHIISKSASALTNGEETTYYIIFKMLSTLSCLLSDRSSLMEKSNTLY
jgi:hypothetical protein